jgi:hypothetical protein
MSTDSDQFSCFSFTVARLDGRAMSPAQSEDSGLAADRGSTYATISIPRQNCQSMGIIFAGKINETFVPSTEARARRLFPHSRLFSFSKNNQNENKNFRHISLRCKKSCWRDVKLISRCARGIFLERDFIAISFFFCEKLFSMKCFAFLRSSQP